MGVGVAAGAFAVVEAGGDAEEVVEPWVGGRGGEGGRETGEGPEEVVVEGLGAEELGEGVGGMVHGFVAAGES